MKVKKIQPQRRVEFITVEELLERTGMTREEWNDHIAERIKEIEADPEIPKDKKERMITSLLMQTITKNNRFLFEELLG